MTTVRIYDDTKRRIDILCEENDVTETDLGEAIIDAVERGEIKLEEWL